MVGTLVLNQTVSLAGGLAPLSWMTAAVERGFLHSARRPRANTKAVQASKARAALGPMALELLDLATLNPN